MHVSVPATVVYGNVRQSSSQRHVRLVLFTRNISTNADQLVILMAIATTTSQIVGAVPVPMVKSSTKK